MNINEFNANQATIVKNSNSYVIKDSNGIMMSKLGYFDYSRKGFDWILIANVETKPEYRGMGLASKLIDQFCTDSKTKFAGKGLYLLVKEDNDPAIHLYKKKGSKIAKKYKMKDGMYLVMYKGSADKNQLINTNYN